MRIVGIATSLASAWHMNPVRVNGGKTLLMQRLGRGYGFLLDMLDTPPRFLPAAHQRVCGRRNRPNKMEGK